MKRKSSPVFFAVFALIIAAIARYISQDVMIRGLIKVVWKRFTEKVLPPQPVYWLKDYQSKEDLWQHLTTTREFEKRPNILLILADDLGVNDVSGGAGVATPFIDSIAKNGLNFTQAYSSQASCAPSRAALFTGRYPTSIGMEFTPIPKFFAKFMADKRPAHAPQTIYHHDLYDLVPDMVDLHMPKEVPLMSEVLRQYGYSNYFLGKWDGSFKEDENSPLHRGYDETLAILLGSSLYAAVDDPRIVSSNNISVDQFMKRMLSYKIQHNNGAAFRPSEYMTDYLGIESSHLIHKLAERRTEPDKTRQVPDDPWFMTVAFTAPHNPFQALKSDYEEEEIQKIPSFIGRIYASMIKALDRNVGRIIEALKETNQYDNTIIIFTSDNGAAPYVGLPHLNAPYRGWKGTLFEGGVRIPFFLQWPKKITEVNRKVNEMIMHIDILPSVVAVATKGIKFLSDFSEDDSIRSRARRITNFVTDGVNILQNFIKQSPAKDSVSAKSIKSLIGQNSSISSQPTQPLSQPRSLFWRSGDYKAVRHGNYKLQIHTNPNKMWFYNLLIDPSERVNLVDHINLQLDVEERISSSEHLDALIIRRNSTVTSSPVYEVSSIGLPTKNLLARPQVPKFQHYSEVVDITHPEQYKSDVLVSNLINVYQKLRSIDAEQREPIWRALAEVPVCIDKPAMSSEDCLLSDEYIIWPN